MTLIAKAVPTPVLDDAAKRTADKGGAYVLAVTVAPIPIPIPTPAATVETKHLEPQQAPLTTADALTNVNIAPPGYSGNIFFR